MRRFLPLWIGQLLSQIGSGLTTFGLGVWVYQETGSVTRFALIALFSTFPGIVAAPFAGLVVDRFSKRAVLCCTNLGSGAVVAAIAALLARGALSPWHLYLLLGVSSVLQAVHWPALIASSTALVEPALLSRTSGMIQLGDAASRIAAPSLAGLLLASLHLWGLLLVDMASFAVGALSVLLTPGLPAAPQAPPEAGKASPLAGLGEGWRFLRGEAGLLALLVAFAGFNFIDGVVQVLLTPLVLSFSSPSALGVVVSCAGLGILAGSLTASLLPAPRERVRWILGLSLAQAAILAVGGLRPSLALVGAAVVGYASCSPLVNAFSQSLWQERAPLEIQGRVFALRRMVAWSTLPLAYGLAGPLADHVLEPWFAPGGLLASLVGSWFGTGKGRGIAFLFSALGLLAAAGQLVAARYRPLRDLDLPPAA
ncbi:MAG TPA: MFS transporter [Thermoanaerobaculia bacterium]|nr:MFS transporter [Thermoanaerobaculia bacterium]